MKTYRNTDTIVVLFLVALTSFNTPAQAAARQSVSGDTGYQLVHAALAPYLTPHAYYKGVRTTTTIVGNESSEISTTATLLVQSNPNGEVERMRAQLLCWGHQGDRVLSGESNGLGYFDGKTLLLYRPMDNHEARMEPRPFTLSTLLGLPTLDGVWSVLPHRHNDDPNQIQARSRRPDGNWTVIVDAFGRLVSFSRSTGTHSQRTVIITTLHDLPLDSDLSDAHFDFPIPADAQEDSDLLHCAAALIP